MDTQKSSERDKILTRINTEVDKTTDSQYDTKKAIA